MPTFQEMPLAPELQKALLTLNFTEPKEIQSLVIPDAMQDLDLIACAETGSGKTAAYAIPIISQLLKDPKRHALVLAPTRELVQQISTFFRQLTTHCRGLHVTPLVGGADIRKQFRELKRRPRIIIATPGRLIDHLNRKSLQLNNTRSLVLDEGDRMLDMGFAPQLNQIVEFLPEVRQTSLFTATMPKKVQELAETYLSNPKKITAGRISLPVASIKQSIVKLSMSQKNDKILDELNQREGSIIIFTRTKSRTDLLAKNLKSYGFEVDLIHGGRTQGQRNRAIKNFRSGQARILCATDVAARGIDIPEVQHVINFDLPMAKEDYVHRIGRTGRNGASGEALSFVTPQEYGDWNDIARKYQIEGVFIEGQARRNKPAFSRGSSRGKGPGPSRPFKKPQRRFSSQRRSQA